MTRFGVILLADGFASEEDAKPGSGADEYDFDQTIDRKN